MSTNTPRIVLMSGSTRRNSLNGAVLATLGPLLAQRAPGCRTDVLEIGGLPHYERELEAVGCAPAREARELVAAADLLVISTPAYNGEIPGTLKNALDWLSRPTPVSALEDRTAVIASASPGVRGGIAAQTRLRALLTHCGVRVVEHPEVAVGRAAALRTADGRYDDPGTVAALASLADAALTAVAGRHGVTRTVAGV